MNRRSRFGALLATGVAGVLATTIAGVPAALAHEGDGSNAGRWSFSINNDFTTAYFFRGILQERDGLIWEPSIDLSLNVYEGDGALSSVDLGFGVWASYHSEKTLNAGTGAESLYEVDYYPSISLSWANGLTTSATYYFYTSPNGAFGTVQQFDLGLSYDDSELLGAFAFGPTVVLSFETDKTSFGPSEGTYLEFSGAPGFEVGISDATALGVSFPVVVGLSLENYYDDGIDDDAFGFASFGMDLSLPLSCIPEDFGAWSLGAGVDLYVLSDTLEAANNGDDPYVVGTGSITVDY